MTPPDYTPIPQESQEKRSLFVDSEQDSTSSSQEPSSPSKSTSSTRSLIVAVLCTLLMISAGSLCMFGGAHLGKGLANLVNEQRVETVTEYVTVTENGLGNWKWWNKRSAGEDDEDRYSTSTLRDGSTQTFVFTTRPIVNPGGYTIGTLTGYVPVSSTTSDAGPTTTAEPITTSTSTSKPHSSSSKSASSTHTRSASTIPAPSSHSKTSASPSCTGSSSVSEVEETSWSKVPTTSMPAPTATFEATSVVASAPSQEFDFAEVDYHLLQRRGINFEEPDSSLDSESPEEAPSSTITSTPSPTATGGGGVEEFSTSTDRKGSVYTLVKTTRPIVNPGGYTIGTLNGGWIDVDKIKPTQTSTKKYTHDELRKRSTFNL